MAAKKAAKKAALVIPPFPTECIVTADTIGLINGVVIGKRKVLTARHLMGNAIGVKVRITMPDGAKTVRTIMEISKPDLRVDKRVKMAKTDKEDRYYYGDICVLTVDWDFPVTPLPIGVFKAGKVTAFHKDRTTAEHTVTVASPNWLHAEWGGRKFEPGDSGFPWLQFNTKLRQWQVVGLTSRGAVNPQQTPWEAESPRLGSKLFKPYLT